MKNLMSVVMIAAGVLLVGGAAYAAGKKAEAD